MIVFERYGVALDNFVVENISLPEELQKAIDTRISMGMMGDMAKYTQYQVASAIPLAAQNEGGVAGFGANMAAGMVMGQAMAQGLKPMQAEAAPQGGHDGESAGADPTTRLGQLKALLEQGLIAQVDYDSAKADILKKLIG